MDECLSEIECDDTTDPGEFGLVDEPKQPFFYVSKISIEMLLGCKATAEQICAFIVVAKSRHSNKNFLTAGSNAISKCLGVRPQKAKRIFSELSSLNHNGTNLVKALPYAPIRSSVKFVDKGSSYGATLFLAHLVGHKTATREYPISKLCKAGDTAARLFLYLYSYCTQEADGVIASKASEMHSLKVVNSISIFCGQIPDLAFPAGVLRAVCSAESHTLGKDCMGKEVSDALKKLIDLKLVVPVVVVKVHKPGKVFGTHYYDLHIKGGPLKGSLRECIKQIALDNAVYQGRSDGRSHDGVYHAIAPHDSSVDLLQALRPIYQYKPASSVGASYIGSFMLETWLSSLKGTNNSILGDTQRLSTALIPDI